MTKNKKSLAVLIISFFFVVLLVVFGYLLFFSQDFNKSNKKGKEAVPEESFYAPTQEKSKDLPSFFPRDFPIYPGSVIDSVNSVGEESIRGVSALWIVKMADVEKVADYYKKNLEEKGWDYENMSEDDFNFTFSFEKDVSCERGVACQSTGFVGITEKDEEVFISVTMGIQKK